MSWWHGWWPLFLVGVAPLLAFWFGAWAATRDVDPSIATGAAILIGCGAGLIAIGLQETEHT